ncbi:MAG: hypothetical protein HN737_13060 [Desulfobacterales bacterium]|jgi:hypothetical protein|nr:hypothetical protein [Desulfobacteraceae bacterium]MBT4363767.1 hypothetical protein [Desulfobacteraceae bacterium]MBT7084777.1 hypothetical protein [Desulfobacterales bacterium]MBT7698326.1 hypothetical protein [Desulfobacterales bacterium]
MKLRTCVDPSGSFIYGIHKPSFRVQNLREFENISSLGEFTDGSIYENHANFPEGNIEGIQADIIYEIPNAFPFRGTTYITKSWADEKAENPGLIFLPKRSSLSFTDIVKNWIGEDEITDKKLDSIFKTLPDSLLLTIAVNSNNADDLTRIAEDCCEFIHDPESKTPKGLRYKKDEKGRIRAVINNFPVFEALANNPHMPDEYKDSMVLRPGAQGVSEIVGEWLAGDKDSHVFEYLRRNSYIPWGHYAANMANDSIRYSVRDLTLADMTGMRHLYYQRTFVRLSEQLGLKYSPRKRIHSPDELEEMRKRINEAVISMDKESSLNYNSTLWGWNFGFDFAPTHYRLHASHQQIHQQFALIPQKVASSPEPDKIDSDENKDQVNNFQTYACGDLVADFSGEFRKKTGKSFFDSYIKAILANKRIDGREGESSLIVYKDDNVIIFVPKAQTSQWELQLMTLKPVGNIIESDTATRASIDCAMLVTMKIYESMGARMVSTSEYSKRFDSKNTDQRLLYSFLPKMPESPGAFSESQLRWINGHYPEDFASACLAHMPEDEAL